ncbi:MAG TPA: alpha/beta family hydrolase [Gemmatimonadota bacterium]|jgi:alpha/beta superfamily hydrolase
MSTIESFRVRGPAGALEALLKRPAGGDPAFAALVCHPHPLHGGTMHNKVVFSIAKALGELGAPVLRFNFRGVGASAGVYAKGVGEREDARAALDHLAGLFPGLPLCLGGFSFGAWVGSAVGCEDDRVTQLVAAGTPTRMFESPALFACRKRKLFVQGEHDEHGPPDELRAFVARVPDPKRLAIVAGADHFFTGRQAELRAAIVDYFAAEGLPPALTHSLRDRGPSNSQR